MAKLRLGPLNNDRPVKVAVELPATVHRDLVVYAEILARESNQPINDPVKLIAPMLARFMATDRAPSLRPVELVIPSKAATDSVLI